MDIMRIEELITEDIKSLGCDVWGIELSGRVLSPTLRVFINKEKGISIEDCEKVSRHISKVLEVEGTFGRNFSLAVSSPGMDRKFFKKSQYVDYLIHVIKVRFKTEEDLFVTRKGTLKEANENGLVLESNNINFYIEFDSIEKANLEIEEEL